MSLEGFTSPRTPEGRSSLVPRPPWHYVGAFLVIDYWADPEKAVAFLPEGIDPHPDPGRCAFVAADWQSCSESADELVDPSRSQYKEVFVVVNGLLEGEEVTTCAYIWVDRDFALARGWIQGFPKKLGSIWITRSFGLGGPADPGMEAGARFGVTCAAYERRVAEATVTLERPSGGGPFHNAAADRQRPSLPTARRGKPRRARGARARSRRVARPVELRGRGRAPRRSSCTAPTTRRSTRSRPSASGAATASRSPIRSTTSRPYVSSRTESRVVVAGVEVATDHFIGGERVASARTFVDLSPIDAEPIAEVARGGEREADLAVAAATEAFPDWAALGPDGRAAHLHRLADLIDESVERLAAVECADMAMLLRSLRARVISRGARNFRAYADLAVAHEERVWESNGTRNRVVRMPSGPAVVITPWNAPFMLSTWKTAPALAAGCTVVLKPAEWSPLSCSLLCDLVAEAGFPPGVFNVVQGIGEEAGAALTRHPGVAQDLVHRLARDRRPHRHRRGPERRAVHRGAGREGPAARLP